MDRVKAAAESRNGICAVSAISFAVVAARVVYWIRFVTAAGGIWIVGILEGFTIYSRFLYSPLPLAASLL
jgi:hypothetical protein